nr:phosphodiester glycosidase family protein [Candidatus Gracilibacteria bacterium]
MKKIFKIIFLLYFIFSFSTLVSANNDFFDETLSGITVKVVKYDLSSTGFTFKIGMNQDGNATSLRELMEANNGITAVNGIYFCPKDYSECNGKDFTINERYINGKKIAKYDDTGERVVFALDKNNKPFLFQTNNINPDKEEEIYNGVANFPLILKDGKNMIEHYWDVGLIDTKMMVKMNRNFICTDKEKRYLYFGYVYNIELNYLHSVLTKIGCYDAINLDAGKSSAMIYNSRYIVGPGRNILDALIIEKNGLDTKEIRDTLKVGIEKIDKYLKNQPIGKKIIFIDGLTKSLEKYRRIIYDFNSRDLYDENGNVIGYEIYANSTENLKKLYIINYLDKLLYEYKKQVIKDDEERKSGEDPLF